MRSQRREMSDLSLPTSSNAPQVERLFSFVQNKEKSGSYATKDLLSFGTFLQVCFNPAIGATGLKLS